MPESFGDLKELPTFQVSLPQFLNLARLLGLEGRGQTLALLFFMNVGKVDVLFCCNLDKHGPKFKH